MKLLLPALFITYLFSSPISAQAAADSTLKVREPIQRFYIGGGLDGAMFSTATVQRTTPTGTTNTMGKVRFSYVLNTGISFNFNFGRYFGAFTGVDIKNMGFIEDVNGVTVKHRTYNVGAPVGIKIGSMRKKGSYLFFGGGADIPVNYREKSFVIRDQKTKFNEWFSERTPQVMPYVFVGVKLKKTLTIKAQYYPENYLNPNYTTTISGNTIRPYQAYDVHIMQLSLGMNVHYSKKHGGNKITDGQKVKLM